MKIGALIGCGFFAQNHIQAWNDISGVRIDAVCDLDKSKAEAFSKQFGGAQVFSSIDQMLNAHDLDFIDIATVAASHRTIVEQVCGHADLIICQKPFAENLADAQTMVSAVQATGAQLLIHENFRWQKAFVTMKALLDKGRIGAPHFARFSFRHGYDNYANQPYLAEIKRFTIMDVGLHLFDLARHFMGDVTRQSCTTQRVNPIVKGEDVFTALLAHDSGATSTIDCSFYSKIDPEPFPQTAAWVEGNLGTLELRTNFELVVHGAGTHEILNVEPPVPHWGERPWHNVQDSVIRLQTHATEIMAGKTGPQPSGRDNLKTMALALAAYDSAETGQTIDMTRWKAGAK